MNSNKITKIAVLTSGGDSPSMNAAIRSIVRTAIKNNLEIFGVTHGYKGLYRNEINKLTISDTAEKIGRGGTFLLSARFPEFEKKEIRQVAIDNLKSHEIDALVVIGGNGSYLGAQKLTEMGMPCITLPGTIDNDIAGTDYTLGFETALNTVVEAIDKLKDTSYSHERCSIVEVMGRDCGDLSLYAGVATGAEITLIPECDYPVEDIIKDLKNNSAGGKKNSIIVFAEGVKTITSDELLKIIIKEGYNAHKTVLGHVQRGGVPVPRDRILATQLGDYAIKLLLKGKQGVCVGTRQGQLVYEDIATALNQKKPFNKELYMLANKFLDAKNKKD